MHKTAMTPAPSKYASSMTPAPSKYGANKANATPFAHPTPFAPSFLHGLLKKTSKMRTSKRIQPKFGKDFFGGKDGKGSVGGLMQPGNSPKQQMLSRWKGLDGMIPPKANKLFLDSLEPDEDMGLCFGDSPTHEDQDLEDADFEGLKNERLTLSSKKPVGSVSTPAPKNAPFPPGAPKMMQKYQRFTMAQLKEMRDGLSATNLIELFNAVANEKFIDDLPPDEIIFFEPISALSSNKLAPIFAE